MKEETKDEIQLKKDKNYKEERKEEKKDEDHSSEEEPPILQKKSSVTHRWLEYFS